MKDFVIQGDDVKPLGNFECSESSLVNKVYYVPCVVQLSVSNNYHSWVYKHPTPYDTTHIWMI